MSPDPIAAPPHHGPGAPTAMAQFMDLMADDPYQAPTLACFPEQAAHSRTVALVELHDPNPVDSIMGMALGELFAAVQCVGQLGRERWRERVARDERGVVGPEARCTLIG